MTAQQAPLGEKTMAVLMAMLVALMPFSVDAYLPAIPEMAKSLGSDIHRIEQSLSFFMFGVAFGQVVGGSISDIKGRKPVALVGLGIYFAAVIGLTMVNNVEQLLNLRAVQAFGAGMTVVISGAMVRDYYSGRKAAQMFALIGIILMIVPLMAADDWCRLAEFGRLAHDFRLSGLLFAAALGFDVVFPAQATPKRQNQHGRVRRGGRQV